MRLRALRGLLFEIRFEQKAAKDTKKKDVWNNEGHTPRVHIDANRSLGPRRAPTANEISL